MKRSCFEKGTVENEIVIPEEMAARAMVPLQRMVDFRKKTLT